MPRLLLVDTSDVLPGLLPIHGWSALMTSDLVLTASEDHPFTPHLDAAELRHEIVPSPDEGSALARQDLLSGLSPVDKARAEWIVDRVREVGEVTYLFGPSDGEAFTRTLGMEAARAQVEVEVVYFGVAPKGTRLLELVAVEERLRGPGGCPWDLEQDHASLGRYAIEEVYELLEAIASGDPEAVQEELGDVLLQVVFHAQIADDEGTFDIDAVAGGIAEKLVRRHPHVFADVDVADSSEVMRNWEDLKAQEKPERDGPFDGVPTAQPALQLVEKYQKRAAKHGFDRVSADEALDEVRAAVEAFASANSEDGRAMSLGDLLAAVVDVARRHRIDPESALRGSARRFRSRFERLVEAAGRPLSELSREDLLVLWRRTGDE
jgi:XTP/dITP diphosphohydrolase